MELLKKKTRKIPKFKEDAWSYCEEMVKAGMSFNNSNIVGTGSTTISIKEVLRFRDSGFGNAIAVHAVKPNGIRILMTIWKDGQLATRTN